MAKNNNQKPNNRRQFLKNTALASLGLSTMLNLSAKTKPKQNVDLCTTTTPDYYGEGPFYTNNPPLIVNNALVPITEPGERMIISGRIYNLDCSQVIPNAVVDIWHANHNGQYDNVGYNLRGYTVSNNQGFYIFETIKPGKYLNGAQYRPSHIHFKITPPDFPTLTTQLYFEGDTDIDADAAASIETGTYNASDRIINLNLNSDNVLEGTWDIIINGNGTDVDTGMQDLHLNKGMIYEVSPNPFFEELRVFYGVFKRAKIGLIVFDLQGNTVAVLEETTLSPEKYTAVWQPDPALPKGHYFVVLKINDLQVHYKKVIKK